MDLAAKVNAAIKTKKVGFCLEQELRRALEMEDPSAYCFNYWAKGNPNGDLPNLPKPQFLFFFEKGTKGLYYCHTNLPNFLEIFSKFDVFDAYRI